MLDDANGAEVAASQRNIVIGLSTLENLANESNVANDGSLTVQ